jgi:hypothetical protein
MRTLALAVASLAALSTPVVAGAHKPSHGHHHKSPTHHAHHAIHHPRAHRADIEEDAEVPDDPITPAEEAAMVEADPGCDQFPGQVCTVVEG